MSSSKSQEDVSHSPTHPPEGTALAVEGDFIEQVRLMTSRERVGYMVSAGINKADGKLTDEYRD